MAGLKKESGERVVVVVVVVDVVDNVVFGAGVVDGVNIKLMSVVDRMEFDESENRLNLTGITSNACGVYATTICGVVECV